MWSLQQITVWNHDDGVRTGKYGWWAADSLAEVAKTTVCAKLTTPRVGVKSIHEFLPLTATVSLHWYPPVHKEPLVSWRVRNWCLWRQKLPLAPTYQLVPYRTLLAWHNSSGIISKVGQRCVTFKSFSAIGLKRPNSTSSHNRVRQDLPFGGRHNPNLPPVLTVRGLNLRHRHTFVSPFTARPAPRDPLRTVWLCEKTNWRGVGVT